MKAKERYIKAPQTAVAAGLSGIKTSRGDLCHKYRHFGSSRYVLCKNENDGRMADRCDDNRNLFVSGRPPEIRDLDTGGNEHGFPAASVPGRAGDKRHGDTDVLRFGTTHIGRFKK